MGQIEIREEFVIAECPDFVMWKKNLIRTKYGICFAPEDLYLCDMNSHRRTVFSWHEAVCLEHDILRVAGFRLPTIDELLQLVEQYGDSGRLIEKCRFNHSGFALPNDMESVFSSGSTGHYWSSTDKSFRAYQLILAKPNCLPRAQLFSKNYGAAVRCVALR